MALRAMEAPQPVRALPNLDATRERAYELLGEIWDGLRLLINAYDTYYPARPSIPREVLASYPGGRLRLEEDGVTLELYETPGSSKPAYTIKVSGVPLPPPLTSQIPWSSEEARHLVVEGGEKGFRLCEAVALGHLMAHPKIGGKVKKLVERLLAELKSKLSPEDFKGWDEFIAAARNVATSLERAVELGIIPAELLENWFFQVTQPFVINVDENTTVYAFAADVPAVAVRRRMPDGRYGYWLIADFTQLAREKDERVADEAVKLGVKIVEGEEVLGLVAKHAPTLAEHLRDYATGLSTEEVLPVLEWFADFVRRLREALSPVVTLAAAAKAMKS